ncbi:hypothetical protein L6452_29978 [Arctium lappa]|uniref:Uncharacterized protein n=1 Tax=Arctium lappa TaxID=4217 RepID=A0ACB8ZGT4_ARCLA|nr:hypothetical protein L6452_29978 [Arctium lappa]
MKGKKYVLFGPKFFVRCLFERALSQIGKNPRVVCNSASQIKSPLLSRSSLSVNQSFLPLRDRRLVTSVNCAAE